MGIGLGFGLGPLRFYIPLVRGGRGRSRAKWWTHPGCQIRHRTQDAANRCRVGRTPAPRPAPPTPSAMLTAETSATREAYARRRAQALEAEQRREQMVEAERQYMQEEVARIHRERVRRELEEAEEGLRQALVRQFGDEGLDVARALRFVREFDVTNRSSVATALEVSPERADVLLGYLKRAAIVSAPNADGWWPVRHPRAPRA